MRTRHNPGVFNSAGLLLPGVVLAGLLSWAAVGLAQLDLSVFRREGASEEQQSTDRYECHKAAVQVLGFDPTVRPSDDTPPWLGSKEKAQLKAHQDVDQRKKQQEYNEIVRKCMERRGYTLVDH